MCSSAEQRDELTWMIFNWSKKLLQYDNRNKNKISIHLYYWSAYIIIGYQLRTKKSSTWYKDNTSLFVKKRKINHHKRFFTSGRALSICIFEITTQTIYHVPIHKPGRNNESKPGNANYEFHCRRLESAPALHSRS